MNPVKILIVEDEVLIALGLKVTLEGMGYEVPAVLDCGQEAVADFDAYKPDLIFMDIHLANNTNGIEAARRINAIRTVPIVFITQSQDEQLWNNAILKGHAAYYLLKPFSKSQISIAVAMGLKHAGPIYNNLTDDAKNRSGADQDVTENTQPSSLGHGGSENYTLNDCIFIRENYGFVKVFVHDIFYLQADGSYCVIHTKDKVFTLTGNLSHFENKLSFFTHLRRCHRSYVVNIARVTALRESEVSINGTCIPIGEKYGEDFKNQFRLIR